MPNPTPSPNPDPVRVFEGLIYWAKSGFDNWQDEMEYRRRRDALRALSPAEAKLMAEEEAQAEQRRKEIQAQVEATYGKGRPKC